mmetsp:Transcript_21567/g.42860  ORF Transcript_21567/g.42860 Transcript_21567/m.42860 type:complete len:97 (-) Transcript_21567:93-383(-)
MPTPRQREGMEVLDETQPPPQPPRPRLLNQRTPLRLERRVTARRLKRTPIRRRLKLASSGLQVLHVCSDPHCSALDANLRRQQSVGSNREQFDISG